MESRWVLCLLQIDTADCGIARLKGTHLEFMPNIYSGSGGKRYKTNFNIEKFFEQVQKAVETILKKRRHDGDFWSRRNKKKICKFY